MSKKKSTVNDDKKKPLNFLAYFKHLWQDPVKTLPEAKARRKKVLKVLLISLVIFAVPIMLLGVILDLPEAAYNIVSKVIAIPIIIGAVGLVYSGLLYWLLRKVTIALQLRECTNCKEIINNLEGVTYTVLREWVKKTVSTTNNVTHVKQDEMAEVEINCTCQNCGTPKKIVREFLLAHYLDGNLKSSYDLENLISDFITGKKV